MEDYQKSPLWQQAFGLKNDDYDRQRQLLVTAFSEFRDRVSMLVAQIHKDMPSLTVQDISHIDALWWTASEITGPDYPLNPAEAFVLGGAFLLHDSAHCVAAYPGGIDEIRELPEWSLFCAALKLKPDFLVKGTEEFQRVLFEVLRCLHPKQARVLARQSWTNPTSKDPMFLLPQDDLRGAYSEAIGLIAESHWYYPHQLEILKHIKIMPPAYIHSAPWTIDVLKLALILRTADAAHIDSQRAPRFLQALVNPSGLSSIHWSFQARINKPKRDIDPKRKELCFSASSFPIAEQDSWWMAYDTARMVDNELRAADRLLVDHNRPQFAVRSVANVHSSENFSRNVPAEGWHPVDTSVKISNINKMVERFGGEKLYGKEPSAALRELIQNAADSIHACRALGGLGEDEGEITISHEESSQGDWLHVTDTGSGMSRYVLTDVLLDFGKSLWRSADLQGEWHSLIPSDFEAIGKFGIGFFSVFMLGSRVRVVTRRFEPKENESSQWLLDFANGTEQRPTLRSPMEHEKLKRHGTKISILLGDGVLKSLKGAKPVYRRKSVLTLSEVCARLAPTLDINLFSQDSDGVRVKAVQANDWLHISNLGILKRIAPSVFYNSSEDGAGPWNTMEAVYNREGSVIGRCSINSRGGFYLPSSGKGVCNGILAGDVHGILGIINVVSQEDLARSSATPCITSQELQVWANSQVELFLDKKTLTTRDSALLAYYGAGLSKLTIGRMEGGEVTCEELRAFCNDVDTVVMYEGNITHEDDDDVLSRDFNSHYRKRAGVLEVDSPYCPEWVGHLVQDGVKRNKFLISSAVESVFDEIWGGFEFAEDIKSHVGDVLGVEIFRDCIVYKRP